MKAKFLIVLIIIYGEKKYEEDVSQQGLKE